MKRILFAILLPSLAFSTGCEKPVESNSARPGSTILRAGESMTIEAPKPREVVSVTPTPPAPELKTEFANVDEALEALRGAAEATNSNQLRASRIWLTKNKSEAIPALTAVMEDSGASIPFRVASTRVMGDLGVEAIPALVEATSCEEQWVKMKAITALGSVQPPTPEAFAHLYSLIDNEDESVRRESIRMLGYMGPLAANAIPRLLEIYNGDGSDSLRGQAHEALQKIDIRTGLQDAS